MEPDANVAEKANIKQFLQDFCVEPRTLSEIMFKLFHDVYHEDKAKTDEALSVVLECIKEREIFADVTSCMGFRTHDDNTRYRSRQTKGDEEDDQNSWSLEDFREILKFLSLFYDLASGSFSYEVISPDCLYGRSTAAKRTIIEPNGFSLVDTVALRNDNPDDPLKFSGFVRLTDSEFVNSVRAETNKKSEARMVLGAPLLVVDNQRQEFSASGQGKSSSGSKLARFSLVPVFYFSLTKAKFTSDRTLQSGEVFGPFFNDSFASQMLELYEGKRSKQNIKQLLEGLEDAASDLLEQESDLMTIWEEINRLIFSFFSDICYGAGGDLAIGKIDKFQKLTNLDHQSSMLVNAALVAPASESNFSIKTSRDFKKILQASDDELRQSALSCFFSDPKTETVRAQGFNAFGVESKAAVVYDLNDDYPCDQDQAQAVRSMLKNDLTVLQGPPGTGKTMTVATAAYNHLLRGQKVLVTSYNHAAIDAFYDKSIIELPQGRFRFAKLLKNPDNSTALTLKQLAQDLVQRSKQVSVEQTQDFEYFAASVEQKEQEIAGLERLLREFDVDFNKKQSEFDEQMIWFLRQYATNAATAEFPKDVPEFIYTQLLDPLFGLKKEKESENWSFQVPFSTEAKQQKQYEDGINDLKRKLEEHSGLDGTYPPQDGGWKHLRQNAYDMLKGNKLIYRLKHDQLQEILNRVLELTRFKSALCQRKKDFKLSEPDKPVLDFAEVHKRIEEIRAQITNDVTQWIAKISPQEELVPAKAGAGAGTGVGGVGGANDTEMKIQWKAPAVTSLAVVSLLRNVLKQKDVDELLLKPKYAAAVLDFFPVSTCTLLSVAGSLPLQSAMFDLVIFDEAAQFNFIDAIPIMFRAKRVAVVGDPKQLAQIGAYSQSLVLKIAKAVGLPDSLRLRLDCNASLYDFAKLNCATNLKKQERDLDGELHELNGLNGKDLGQGELKELILRQNRRSVDDIVSYISRSFYEDQLTCKTEVNRPQLEAEHRILPDMEMGLHFVQVPHDELFKDPLSSSSFSRAEAQRTMELLQQIVASGYRGTIGVIAPFRRQIGELQMRVLSDPTLRALYQEGERLVIDTVHRFQGRDCDTIIYNLCLAASGGSQFALDENITNVALSRARYYLFVVGDPLALQVHANQSFVRNLLPFVASQNISGQADGEHSAAFAAFADVAQIRPCLDRVRFDTVWERILFDQLRIELRKDEFFVLYGIENMIFTQLPILCYRLDLAMICGNRGLDIECDGSQHYENWFSADNFKLVPSDLKREADLRDNVVSFETIRFRNIEIENNPEACAKKVLERFKEIVREVQAAAKASQE